MSIVCFQENVLIVDSKSSVSLCSKREYYFQEGLAQFKKDGKWGFIDKYGKEVIPLQFAGALNFSEELAPVKMKDGKWGYINKMGKFLIKGFFDVAHCFQHGEAAPLNQIP